MATVLLLRHGRTTANATGELAGRLPVELDDTGRGQAQRVGERLRKLPLAAVVTSPLIRCRQTLELALPDIVPEVDEGLIECGYGDWEGRPLKELTGEPLWPVGNRSNWTTPGVPRPGPSASDWRTCRWPPW